MSKPYPWLYAVNDRPVMIVELPGGGADCLVLDMYTGNFVTDRDYFERTVPGGGKDVDAFTPEAFARLVAMQRAGVLQRLAERICDGGLGVSIDPPPLGGTAARALAGDRPSLEIELPEGVLTRADIEARLGAPSGSSGGGELCYRVAGHCAVLARFPGEPDASTPVAGLLLRCDPG